VLQDLQAQYNASATAILEAFKEHLPQLDVPQMLAEIQVGVLSALAPACATEQ
jgi:hypothetical protein